MGSELTDIYEAALEIARLGGDHTLNYYRKPFEVELKEDETVVTAADREAEEIMRGEILKRFPTHGIFGEEYGKTNTGSDVQWILDPIDGTLSFIHGVPFYTTLIGILVEGEPRIGIIYAPALDEFCDACEGRGARLNGKPCSVEPCSELSEATFLSTDVTTPASFDYEKPFRELLQRTSVHRTWGDAYGHMLVATGRADLMFDPALNLWDAAPLLPILLEAGGIFCDTAGRETIRSGNGFSCSRELYPSILEIFNKHKQPNSN